MKNTIAIVCYISTLALASCGGKTQKQDDEKEEKSAFVCNPSTEQPVESIASGEFAANFAPNPITIDGCMADSSWLKANWYDLNHVWMGAVPDEKDYSGRFKILWDTDFLYLFAEIVDDSLHATLEDGVENYWRGDYVEVFLDEDQSGGDHWYNHQAFAYHVSTEGHAIDKNTNEETFFFDEHVDVVRTQDGDKHYWEIAIKIFDDQFDEDSPDNNPLTLSAQKKIGFSLAYGDNDGNQSRENFMGSKQTHGVNNDEGYKNSDVFGSLLLLE